MDVPKRELMLDERVAIWDAINEYVITCGGDPSKHVHGNTRRQRCVADIEDMLRHVLAARAPKLRKPRVERPTPQPCGLVGCINLAREDGLCSDACAEKWRARTEVR